MTKVTVVYVHDVLSADDFRMIEAALIAMFDVFSERLPHEDLNTILELTLGSFAAAMLDAGLTLEQRYFGYHYAAQYLGGKVMS